MLAFNIKAPILDVDDTGGGEPVHPAKILMLECDEENVTPLLVPLDVFEPYQGAMHPGRSCRSSASFPKCPAAGGMCDQHAHCETEALDLIYRIDAHLGMSRHRGRSSSTRFHLAVPRSPWTSTTGGFSSTISPCAARSPTLSPWRHCGAESTLTAIRFASSLSYVDALPLESMCFEAAFAAAEVRRRSKAKMAFCMTDVARG
jgi:hypothetical protein